MSLPITWIWNLSIRSQRQSRNSQVVSSLSRTISVCPRLSLFLSTSNNTGLISQVAEDLWEVKENKVINLTKQDISIVDYKRMLAKRSTYPSPLLLSTWMMTDNYRSSTDRKGKTYLQKRRQGCRLDNPSCLPQNWVAGGLCFVFSLLWSSYVLHGGVDYLLLVSNSICTRGRGAYCIEFRSGMHLS